jgi:hypothetical protein
MADNESSIEGSARHLIEAVEKVGDGIWKVEVWASALLRFVSPVPVYEPGSRPSAWLPREHPLQLKMREGPPEPMGNEKCTTDAAANKAALMAPGAAGGGATILQAAP